MFRLLKKKIAERIYFLLILAVALGYGGVMLSSFFDEKIIVLVDGEIENSGEDNTSDTDIDDIESIDISLISSTDFLKFSEPFSLQNTSSYLVNIYCNVCLQQKNPPP